MATYIATTRLGVTYRVEADSVGAAWTATRDRINRAADRAVGPIISVEPAPVGLLQVEPFPESDHPACPAGITIALAAALQDDAERAWEAESHAFDVERSGLGLLQDEAGA